MEREQEADVRITTPSGVIVERHSETIDGTAAVHAIVTALDRRLGGMFTSGTEAPGRYARWDLGFVDPPIVLESRGRRVTMRATNARGLALLPTLASLLDAEPAIEARTLYCDRVIGTLAEAPANASEEERLRAPSVLSVVRAIARGLALPEGEALGFYGAFGYDLVFGIEALTERLPRGPDARDVVLFLADDVVRVDRARGRAERLTYELVAGPVSTRGLPREPLAADEPRTSPPQRAPRDPDPARYREGVRAAKRAFARGDLFEAVLSQTFERTTSLEGSAIFERLRALHPTPYGFYLSLGAGERLIGASPEMFVRVEGRRVETCPIAGTIARHGDPLVDADRIRTLLVSSKDEAELTMCTDVDRNDKARVCEPGSVRVIGRRMIEVYSRVIHTVDHVEGRLRDDVDALDALLAHAWAVTVTGAPKLDAMQFVEDHEDEPRGFYGGAVGCYSFDGRLNTGITIRAIHLRGGLARVRVGATLLHASDEYAEEQETRDKAAALLEVLDPEPPRTTATKRPVARDGRTILLVDHRDSFVHTLGDYLRRSGARVVTHRTGFPASLLDELRPDLAVLSPGPGTPSELGLPRTIAALLARQIPIFGVCLGLQGLVEHFGGTLDRLDVPAHGRASTVHVDGGRLFEGLPRAFPAGRYHSLHARPSTMPACLAVTARADDGVVMAIEHRTLPIHAVQFHPESILTPESVGLGLLANLLALDAASLGGADPVAERRDLRAP